ncbi:transcriptional repressor [Parashewanella curva]|uniref:Transcriptional repressor n=1 Tax=Parashewanella curva TaxID=2338552 RepID=A0A3L8PZS3_9GAMM|nr:transcriptional repressor [Parashewanella curva]RLV60861.1 transcriptional repressor [Parashewanella curva]
MTNTNEMIKYAEQKCKKSNAKLTPKRKQVLTGLINSNKAISAYELADYCNQYFDDKFPIMTIYRILEFLEEESLVHKLQTSNKYVACAHIACDHEHLVPQFLICHECQKVKEIHINKNIVNELNDNVEQAGFSMISPQLEINCLCSDCKPLQ